MTRTWLAASICAFAFVVAGTVDADAKRRRDVNPYAEADPVEQILRRRGAAYDRGYFRGTHRYTPGVPSAVGPRVTSKPIGSEPALPGSISTLNKDGTSTGARGLAPIN